MKTSILLSFGVLFCICQSFTAFTTTKLDDNSENTLQAAFIIFRHGDRNPLSSYPKDPYKNYSWPGGYQALTAKGVLQAYNLGTILREKYSNLLTSDNQYSYKDMYVISSDVDRTIMTAESVLAGFLPPSDHENLLPISWQPIPIHTLSFQKDTILLNTRPCFKYNEYLKILIKNPPKDYLDIIQYTLPNETLYEYISRHSGYNVTDMISLLLFYDTLTIEENNNLELPAWTNIISPKNMKSLIERMMGMITETHEMKRLRSGPLLTKIIQIMKEKKMKLSIHNQKLFFFSGHDLTLLSMIRTLDIEDQTTRKPDFTSTLVFEFHQSTIVDNEYEVKLFYYANSDVNQPTQVTIPNCYEPCLLTEFLKIVLPYLVLDYDKACRVRQIGGERFIRW